MTFDEFLNRPRYKIDEIIAAVDEVNRMDQTAQQDIINDLESTKKSK